MTGVEYPSGLIATNLYRSDGWLTNAHTYSVSGGVTTRYGTNSYTYTNGLVLTHTDPHGLTRTFTWDNLQRLTRIAYPDGTDEQFSYTLANGRGFNTSGADLPVLDLTAFRDRRTNSTYFDLDRLRRQVKVTDARGHSTRYVYCECGGLEYITNALSQGVHLLRDNQGRLTQVFYHDNSTETRRYDSLGRLTNVVDVANGSTSYFYNHQGLLTAVSNQVGLVLLNDYDLHDRVRQTTDRNGLTLTCEYDVLDRLTHLVYPVGGSNEQWGYTFKVCEALRRTVLVRRAR